MVLTEANNCRAAINRHDPAEDIARKRQLPHRQDVLTRVLLPCSLLTERAPSVLGDLRVRAVDGGHPIESTDTSVALD